MRLANWRARSSSSAAAAEEAASAALTCSASSLALARIAGRSSGEAFPTDRETCFCSARRFSKAASA